MSSLRVFESSYHVRRLVMCACALALLGAAPPAARTSKPKPAPPLPKGYAASVKGWHAPTSAEQGEKNEAGVPKLVLVILNSGERVALDPLTSDGGFSATELERASQFLRDTRTGNRFPVEPMLLNLAYGLQRHFDVPVLRIVSGYRTPKPGTHSNHGRGRALDLVVPGTSDEDVATFVRAHGFVGVGTYPKSGFVHIDVREHSYFWVDTSGPGRPKRERGVLADVAQRSDAEARTRGEHPVRPFNISFDVDTTLVKTGNDVPKPADHDDEDES